MANTLLLSSAVNIVSTGNTTQFWYNCGAGINVDTTETNTQTIFRSAGTLSNLWVKIQTNSTTITITSRKNAAAGNQTISVTSSATGTFTDATHTDALVAADKVSIRTVPGATGVFVMQMNSYTFAATTNTVQRMVAFDNLGYLTASVTNFLLINGHNDTILTTEPTEKVRQRKSGTFKNSAINLSANTRTTAGTFKSRKNGVDGALTVSVTASTAGFFEDTTHSDSVVATDDYNMAFVTGTGTGTSTVKTNQIDFTNSTGDFELVSSLNGTNNPGSSATRYSFCSGGLDTSTTETDVQAITNGAYTFSNLNIHVSSNSSSGSQTLTFRLGTADSALTLSIAAAGTGEFTDGSHTVPSVATDIINQKIVLGSVGMGISYISVWAILGGSTLFTRSPSDTVTISETPSRVKTAIRGPKAIATYV